MVSQVEYSVSSYDTRCILNQYVSRTSYHCCPHSDKAKARGGELLLIRFLSVILQLLHVFCSMYFLSIMVDKTRQAVVDLSAIAGHHNPRSTTSMI